MPTTKSRPQAGADRRVQRTQQALRVALMHSLMSNDWDDIEVRSLCEKANVGRSTFYQHFDGMEDLLQSSLDRLRDELLVAAGAGQGPHEPLAFLPMLLAHVHQARAILQNTLVRRSGHLVQSRFRYMLVELMQAGTASAPGWHGSARPHLLAGALFGLLVWWLGSDRPQSATEVEALYRGWLGSLSAEPFESRHRPSLG